MSSSTARLYRGRALRQSVWQFYVLPHTRQSGETMTFISAGRIIRAPTQPVGSGRPQWESNPGLPHQETRTLPTERLLIIPWVKKINVLHLRERVPLGVATRTLWRIEEYWKSMVVTPAKLLPIIFYTIQKRPTALTIYNLSKCYSQIWKVLTKTIMGD